uniref:Replication initiation protein n=1 Tax=Streptomyces sp. W75 TaxID=1170711 RepID=I0CEE9_9ACTN|nr:replication initiation protein [Streptomyces sp. W75]
MSFEAVLWATSDAPIANVNEFAVLTMLAEKADSDGCGAFPSRSTLASRTKVDPKTVQRTLAALVSRKLIGLGDQQAASYIRADRRPTVYDLLIPYDWFPNVERINGERAEKGRPPLTRAGRPAIAPAPEKARRSDRGSKRVAKKPAADVPKDVTERGDSESPRVSGSLELHGGTVSPARGDSESGTGGLRDPRTSPLTLSSEPARDAPSARSAPDARRATTGSRGSSSSGSAASSDKKPITTTQRAQVQAVRDLLPPLLARDLPDETPTNISKKILAALDTDGPRPRTPEQLVAYRINPRWDGYWATQYGDNGFDKPLGVVLALVASQAECGNVRCDDRRDVDTGELCPFCAELKADRRVQRRLEQQDAERAAERPSEPRGGRSGDVVPPPRPEAASWAPAAPGAWPTVVAPAEETPVVSTVEIPSPDEVQARTADMRSILRDHRSRPSRAPF